MFNQNGTFYSEEHSISFGEVRNGTFITTANTWTDWHLIPSSVPVVALYEPQIKLIDVPVSDFPIDLTSYLTGIDSGSNNVRKGSFSFYVDNDHEHWETIRQKITNTLHGKRLKMRLNDEPLYYYDGRFTVNTWQSEASHSSVTIEYELDCQRYSL